MSTSSLVFAMTAHVGMTAGLYGLLTMARAPTVWGIGLPGDGTNRWQRIEPRISANLSNQFEWPLFFHVACLLLLLGVGPLDGVQVALAWLFVLGRLIHSAVQIGMDNIRLRGLVFCINFLAVLGMWAWLGVALARSG